MSANASSTANMRYQALCGKATLGSQKVQGVCRTAKHYCKVGCLLHHPPACVLPLLPHTTSDTGQTCWRDQSHNLTNLAESSLGRKERRVFCRINKQTQALQGLSTSANPGKMVEPHLWEQRRGRGEREHGKHEEELYLPFLGAASRQPQPKLHYFTAASG